MGKVPFLTEEQKIILDLVKQNKFLVSEFYFTGGTALSAYYLHHRESEDLDFFSTKKHDNQLFFNLMLEWGRKNGFKFKSRLSEVVYMYKLVFKNGVKLKVDFGYYPYKRLETGKKLNGIEVDSMFDIAVNKLQTVHQRVNVKDFVDLYYLLDKFTVWDLLSGVEHKFRIKMDPFDIAIDFMKVDWFKSLPIMIKKLTLGELKTFFINKAEKLGKKVVKP